MIVVVDMEDGERVILATFSELDFYKVLAVAPAVEKGEAHGVNIVVGIESPMPLLRVTDIFKHGREVLRFDFREKAKEAYASLAASNWRRS